MSWIKAHWSYYCTSFVWKVSFSLAPLKHTRCSLEYSRIILGLLGSSGFAILEFSPARVLMPLKENVIPNTEIIFVTISCICGEKIFKLQKCDQKKHLKLLFLVVYLYIYILKSIDMRAFSSLPLPIFMHNIIIFGRWEHCC